MSARRTSTMIAVYALLVCFGLIALAGCSVGPLGPQSYTFIYTTDRHCSWGTGQQAVCQYTISNDAKSNVTFEWKGASSPVGATFSPDSGSIAPGATSDTITVTDPFLCPITFQFVDAGHNLRIDSTFNDPCK